MLFKLDIINNDGHYNYSMILVLNSEFAIPAMYTVQDGSGSISTRKCTALLL